MKILKNVLPILLLFSFASSFGCCKSLYCGSEAKKAVKKKYKKIRSVNLKKKYKYAFCKLSKNGGEFFLGHIKKGLRDKGEIEIRKTSNGKQIAKFKLHDYVSCAIEFYVNKDASLVIIDFIGSCRSQIGKFGVLNTKKNKLSCQSYFIDERDDLINQALKKEKFKILKKKKSDEQVRSDLEKVYDLDPDNFCYNDKKGQIILITEYCDQLIVLEEEKNRYKYKDKIERAEFLVDNYL